MADLLATFQKIYVEIRDACGANFSFYHQLGHLSPGLLDRRTGIIRAVKLIKIDAFDIQPTKRRFAFAPYGVGLKHTAWFFHTIVVIPDEARIREHIWSAWRPANHATSARQLPQN